MTPKVSPIPVCPIHGINYVKNGNGVQTIASGNLLIEGLILYSLFFVTITVSFIYSGGLEIFRVIF